MAKRKHSLCTLTIWTLLGGLLTSVSAQGVVFGEVKDVSLVLNPSVANERAIVTATCVATCNATCSYRWEVLPRYDGVTWEQTDNTLKLEARRNSTNFTCFATDRHVTESATATLTVNFVGNSRIQVRNGSSYTLLEHQPFPALHCITDSCLPACSSAWILPNSTELDVEELLLSNVTRNDAGQYQCRHGNIAGTQTANIYLHVAYGPDAVTTGTNGRVTVKEDQAMTGPVCAAVNCTKCSVTWEKDGATFSTDPALTRPTVQHAFAGQYRCVVRNTVTGKTLSSVVDVVVQYAPIVNLTQSDDSLLCRVSGVPASYTFLDWYHSKEGQSVREIPVTSQDSDTAVLSLTSYADSGYYTCRVTNDIPAVGHVQTASLEVTVNDKPHVVSMVPNYNSSKGEALTVVIDVFSVPGDLDGTVVNDNQLAHGTFSRQAKSPIVVDMHGKNVSVTSGGFSLTWTVASVGEEDFGHYTIQLTNSVGDVTRRLTVTPTGPPDVPEEVNITDVTSTNISFSLRPGFHGGADQTFYIEYSNDPVAVNWTAGASVYGGMRRGPDVLLNATVSNLQPDTLYYFRVYGKNVFSASAYSEVLQHETAVSPAETTDVVPIITGTVAGLLFLIIIIIVAVIVVKKKKNSANSENAGISEPASPTSLEPMYTNQEAIRNVSASLGSLDSGLEPGLQPGPDTLPPEPDYMGMGGAGRQPVTADGMYIEFHGEDRRVPASPGREDEYMDLSGGQPPADQRLGQAQGPMDTYIEFTGSEPEQNYMNFNAPVRQDIYENY